MSSAEDFGKAVAAAVKPTVNAVQTGRLSEASLAATIDGRTNLNADARASGSLVAWCGDSITNGSSSTNASVYSYWAQVRKILGAKVTSGLLWEHGEPGERSEQLLARMDAIIAAGPDHIYVQIGTNDAGGSVAVGTFSANIQAIKDKADSAGIPSTFGTVPPKGSAGTTQNLILAYNTWMRVWGRKQGIRIAETFGALADPVTGLLNASYNSGDGTHPNNAGHLAMALAISEVLDMALPEPPQMVVAGGVGLLADPLSNSDTVWGSLTANTGTYSWIANDGTFPYGRWFRCTLDNSGGGTSISGQRAKVIGTVGVDVQAGDILLACLWTRDDTPGALGKIIWTDGSVNLSVPYEGFPVAGTRPLLIAYTVPTRTWSSTLRIGFQITAPAGKTVKVDIFGDVFNLTDLGLESLRDDLGIQ